MQIWSDKMGAPIIANDREREKYIKEKNIKGIGYRYTEYFKL